MIYWYNTQCKKWTITIFGFGQILWILWQKKRYFPKELLKVEMWKAVVLKRSSFYVSGLRPFWRDCWRLVNKVFSSTLLGLKLWIHFLNFTILWGYRESKQKSEVLQNVKDFNVSLIKPTYVWNWILVKGFVVQILAT